MLNIQNTSKRRYLGLLLIITFSVLAVSAATLFYVNTTKYDREYAASLDAVNTSSTAAASNVNAFIEDFERSFGLEEANAFSDSKKFVNDICLVDRTYENTNVFEHLFPRKVGESMRCIYQEMNYYIWDKKAEDFVNVLKENQERFNLPSTYPYNVLAEKGATFSVLESDYSTNPAIQIRFARKDQLSFILIDDTANYSQVLYQRRFRDIWEERRLVSTLPEITELLSKSQSDQYVLQVAFLDRYYTFYDNHNY